MCHLNFEKLRRPLCCLDLCQALMKGIVQAILFCFFKCTLWLQRLATGSLIAFFKSSLLPVGQKASAECSKACMVRPELASKVAHHLVLKIAKPCAGCKFVQPATMWQPSFCCATSTVSTLCSLLHAAMVCYPCGHTTCTTAECSMQALCQVTPQHLKSQCASPKVGLYIAGQPHPESPQLSKCLQYAMAYHDKEAPSGLHKLCQCWLQAIFLSSSL